MFPATLAPRVGFKRHVMGKRSIGPPLERQSRRGQRAARDVRAQGNPAISRIGDYAKNGTRFLGVPARSPSFQTGWDASQIPRPLHSSGCVRLSEPYQIQIDFSSQTWCGPRIHGLAIGDDLKQQSACVSLNSSGVLFAR